MKTPAIFGQDKGTDEDLDRIQNVNELYNAVIQFEEENEDATLLTFLASAALSSDMDDDKQGNAVSLMTLHSSKGLEFPVVFVVGMEQGLFPSFRSLNDAAAIEEERRLCYVGITRAQERLFLTYARERRLYGNMRDAFYVSRRATRRLHPGKYSHSSASIRGNLQTSSQAKKS